MEKQFKRQLKSVVEVALMGFLILLVAIMCPRTLSAGDISQVHTGQIGVNMNGSTKRIVFEKEIVVRKRNGASAYAANNDDTGGPVPIYSVPPSLETYPQVQNSNVIDKDESSEAKAGNVPSAIPKVYPDVPPIDFSGRDDTGGPVPIYSVPPSLETYPQVQNSNVIDKDEKGGIGQLSSEEFYSSDDAYSEEIFNSNNFSGTVGEEAKEDEKYDLFATELHSDAVVLYEGFEGAFPGSWQVYGDPTWDDDDYKPYAGSWSCWCANGGSTGLDPATNNYVNNMQAWAIYGPFSLSDASSGSFSFRYWGNTEQNYDYFKYLVSTDGTNFYGYQTSGDSGGWVQKSIDFTSVPTLGNVCGESQVWIAFKFDSDSSYTYKGSFVDEVYVQKSGTTQYPNLIPYQPSGWDGKIIVSNQSGTHSENTVYVGNTSYIDYAYINNGTADISQRFYSEFYVNGSMVRRSYIDGLPVNNYAHKDDFEYTFPSAGTYTLKLVVDVDNDVAESNENDNQYERTKSVGTINEPNLTPYQPSGWDGKIIVSNQSGTHSENTVYVGNTSYIDYAYINNGTADISQRFYSEFYVNGSMVRRSYIDGLPVNNYAHKDDFEYTFPSAGTYTLKLVVDVDNDVAESNENDNQYERTKSVGTINEPNLTPYQPSGWDGKIIVSNQSGTHSENTVYVGNTSYIDYAYINNGTADISQRFYSEFYVNGSMVRRSYKDGLPINHYGYKDDFEYTFPSAGTYTLKLVVDVDNDVAESNENDNEYQRNKEIIPHQGEPIIRIQPTSLAINQAGDSVGDSSGGTFVPVVEGVKSAPQGEPRLDVIQSDKNRLDVKLTTQSMFVEDKTEGGDIYQVIHLGRYNGELPPGQPNLPAIRKHVYVPKGKSASLEVTLGDSIAFTDYLVYPAQLPQLDTVGAKDPPFYRDEDVYSTDEWLPKDMVYLGPMEIIRGHAIRLLSICPFQYNPAKRILRVFPEINAQILFDGQLLDIDSRLRSPVFDRFIKGFVLNPSAFNEGELGLDAYTGENYLIITAPAFETQANALRDHKISRGITTGVVTTTVTGTSSAQIKAYIQNVYDTYYPAPTYVLLLGDVETIPTTYDGTADTGTDLYYSTVDGTDYVPDLFLGRISVDTASEAQTVVNKLINYESNPPTSPSFYTNVAVAAYFQDGTPYPGTPDGYEDRRFVRTSEEVRDFLLGQGYSVNRIYCAEPGANPTNYNNGSYGSGEPLPAELLRANGFAWDGNAADISAAINNGVFLLMHRDHGGDRNDGYSHTGWGDPYYVETHIAALTNNDLLPVVMSINCQTGWFDGETDHNGSYNYESFCELFLRKSGGGAVGVFGATRSSYSGYNDFMAEGMIDCVWPDFLPTVPNSSGASARLGPMLNHGKLAMDQLWGTGNKRQLEYELFHVFGDPSLEMYTTGGGGNTFTIYNDGTADLEITSMTKRDGDAWLSWSPTSPLTIPPGGSRVIAVTVDWNQIQGSSDDEQIIVQSNDTDMSPYPNAVFVIAQKFCPTPGTPSNPNPSDGTTGISINADLDWSDCSNTDSYDVYFGTSSSPPYYGNTSSSNYNLPTLNYSTHYYWKIVAKNDCGNSASGSVWDFITLSTNHDPELTSGDVDPDSGDDSTIFAYIVHYYDQDGDSPSTKYVYIDGSSHIMSLYSGSASDGTYRYQTTLSCTPDPHNYYFEFTDGQGGSDRLPSSGTYSGPDMNCPPPNHDPELTTGDVDPDSGDDSTTFTYTVHYYDQDGDSPSDRYVYIDGASHIMTLFSGSAADGTYRYQTTLSCTPDPHNYYFEFTDGQGGSDRLPSSGTYSGPDMNCIGLYQIVRPANTPIYCAAESEFILPVEYDTSDGNNQLMGIGIRVHFDSSKLNWIDYDNWFPTGLAGRDLVPVPDTSDYDGDPVTDYYLGIAWFDIGSQWPNTALPLRLADMRFRTDDTLPEGDTTQINFSCSSKDSDYECQLSPATVVIIPPCTLDIDGNGQCDALTDGILILRYLFGFRGETLIEGAVAPDCTRCTAPEIEAYLADCVSCCLDIDGNGVADALTDGILILRYLFGFRGATLIDGAVAPDCTRCTVEEIEAYLECLMT